MKHVIVAWCNSDDKAFEAHVPLHFVGKRNKELGFNTPLHVLFLDGFNRLSQQYKASLQELGYILHNASQLYQELSEKYQMLNRFGDYEKKCFLRWLVIDAVFNGEKIAHFDGDIVFNEDASVITNKVHDKTFMLQGCPALTIINDLEWFIQYKSALAAFTQDIEGYSAQAWQKRKGWEISFTTRWAGSRFRPIITSDQDFISHLVHTRSIIQDNVEEILLALDDYIIFQNPLVIHMFNEHFPYRYCREQGLDYFYFSRPDTRGLFYKKRVLLWHMQSCFNSYASKYILRNKYLKIIPSARIQYKPAEKTFEDKLNRQLARLTHHTSRLSVYNYFFKHHDFGGLMSNKAWWKAGLFV